MNKSDLLRYKNLLQAKQQELSTRKSLVGSIPTSAKRCGDLVDMAPSETGAAMRIRVDQTASSCAQLRMA